MSGYKGWMITLMLVGWVLLSPLGAAQNLELQRGGIGILVAQMYSPELYNNIGPLIVLRVIDATPASVEGLEKGDIITHINGEETTGKPITSLISNELRGAVGSAVELTIQREYTSQPFQVRITRTEFDFPGGIHIR